MSHKKILVAGDVMVDRYYEGPVRRVSPEAPVPVVYCPDGPQDYPGGAAHVATAAKALSSDAVGVLGDVGEDAVAEKLRMMLDQHGVWHHLNTRKDAITPLKVRVTSGGRQLMRVDHEFGKASRSLFRTSAVVNKFEEIAREVRVVVLSDYNKGTLPEYAVRKMMDVARKQQIPPPIIADPKRSDMAVYNGCLAVTPNWAEAASACVNTNLFDDLGFRPDEVGDDGEAQKLAGALGRVLPSTRHIVITRGEHGCTWYDQQTGHVNHLPAFSRCVYDVTGAGDVFIAGLAVGIAEDKSFEQALRMANTAAGISVNIPGTSTVGRQELDDVFDATASTGDKIMSTEEAVEWAERRRRAGQRVVLVNGCFDLMHPGHLHLLRSARAYGEKLVVAVNDDASVRSLKGDDRPFHDLADRLAMLAAVGAVDVVVPFEEATPEKLIRAVKPDVLVKGAEYEGTTVPGADYVAHRGGRVVFVPMLPGKSTTALAAAVRG